MNYNATNLTSSLLIVASCFFVVLTNFGVNFIPSYNHGVLATAPITNPFLPPRVQQLPASPAQVVHNDIFSNDLVFVGDVMLARNVERLMEMRGDYYPFSGFDLTSLAYNPYVIGNFEAAIPKIHIPTKPFTFSFSVTATNTRVASVAGFTHFSLANNHSFDHGAEEYKNTLTELKESGFATFGHPYEINDDNVSYLKTTEGIRIALIGVNATEQSWKISELEELIVKTTKHSDFQIVYIHWGVEYDIIHSKAQEVLATRMIKAGADLIVGHHPHVVQDVGYIDGVPVFYSLGNYIFDQYFSPDVMSGLVLRLDTASTPMVIDLIPVTQNNSISRPTIMSPTEHKRFLDTLSRRSDPVLSNYIQTGQIPLNNTLATSTEIAIMSKNNSG
jgi:hypothetical protein